MQLIIILLFILYFCLDTPMKVRLICVRCYSDLSRESIPHPATLPFKRWKDKFFKRFEEYFEVFFHVNLSLYSYAQQIHNLSIAVLSHYSFNSSRKMAGLQPCIHRALKPKSLLHLAVYFDFLFLPVACRDIWGLEAERSRRRMNRFRKL